MTPLFESEETFSSLAAPKDFILLQLQYNPFSGCFLVFLPKWNSLYSQTV